jgi:hypothetical protein
VVRVIGQGFLIGYNTYLRSGWNTIDFVVVIGGCLSWIPSLEGLVILAMLRMFRPFKGMMKIGKIRIILKALFVSILNLGKILSFLAIFLVIFAGLGVNIFQGK